MRVCVGVYSLALLGGSLFGQPAEKPKFEVADVAWKPENVAAGDARAVLYVGTV